MEPPRWRRMRKRPDITPDSQIRSALRLLWMKSRERKAALQRDKYTCVRCGAKQSKANGREVKVQEHHKRQPRWERMYKEIREELLQTPADYETLCEKCHKEVGR